MEPELDTKTYEFVIEWMEIFSSSKYSRDGPKRRHPFMSTLRCFCFLFFCYRSPPHFVNQPTFVIVIKQLAVGITAVSTGPWYHSDVSVEFSKSLFTIICLRYKDENSGGTKNFRQKIPVVSSFFKIIWDHAVTLKLLLWRSWKSARITINGWRDRFSTLRVPKIYYKSHCSSCIIMQLCDWRWCKWFECKYFVIAHL